MKKVINRVFKTYYNIRGARLNYSISNAERVQSSLLDYLIDSGSITEFGQLHNFEEIENYDDFKDLVPISDYTEYSMTKKGDFNTYLLTDSYSNDNNDQKLARINFMNNNDKQENEDCDLMFNFDTLKSELAN